MAAAGAARPVLGIALMTVAMLTVPVADGLAKHLSAMHSPLFLTWARFAAASVLVLPLAAAFHGRRVLPAGAPASHGLRTLFLVAAMTLYFLAIARIPLATAVSAYFVGPVVAMVLSVLVLKERMTTRKAVSLGLGLAGSLVILRPGITVEPGILLALGAGVLFALYLIATRRAAQASAALPTLAFQCLAGTLLLTPQAMAAWSTPGWAELPLFLALGAASAVSHLMSIAAFRLADASILAPLVYVELVGATAVGYFGFGDLPGPAVAAGAGLIAAAGLVLLRPGSRR